MKKIIVFVFSLASLFSIAKAQSQLSESQRAVNQVVVDMFDALAKRDTTTLKIYCTEDMILLEDREVWTLDTLTLKVSQNKDTSYNRVNKMDFIETKIEGKTAWTCYYNQANITRKGKQVMVRWLETAILIKDKQKWKMRVLHSTTIERKNLEMK